MNKFEFKNLTPFKWFVLENFPFIEEDFDALTEWQLFCKLGKEINKIINNTNTLGLQVENLTDFVSNYFDNLDVQEEINNKLNDMAESGELSEIIAQYIQLQGLLCYNTKADMKLAQNLTDGSFAKTFGDITYNDGKGNFYKIREIINTDVVDDVNIIALYDNNLVAELMPNYYINQIEQEISNISNFYNIKPVEFLYNDNGGNQGGCIVGSKLYVYKTNTASTGSFYIYNLTNKTLESTINNVELFHGNGMIYIDGKIYSADFYDSSNAFSKGISIFDIDTSTVTHINPFANENISRCWGIAKFDDTHILVGSSSDSTRLISAVKIYKLDITDLSYVEMPLNKNGFPNYNNNGSLLCDMIFKNNELFILTTYPGQLFRFKLTNNIFYLSKIYNLDPYDDNGVAFGELEGIEIFDNEMFGENTFMIHSNNENCMQCYLVNTESNLSPMEKNNFENTMNNRSIIYLKSSSTSLYENGTEEFPFKSLERAICASANNNNITAGDITIKDNETYYLFKNHRDMIINLRWDNQTPSIISSIDNAFVNCTLDFRSDTNNILNLSIDNSISSLIFSNCKGYIGKINFTTNIHLRRNSNLTFRNCTWSLSTTYQQAIELNEGSFINIISSLLTGYTTWGVNNHGGSIAFVNSYVNEITRTSSDSFTYSS